MIKFLEDTKDNVVNTCYLNFHFQRFKKIATIVEKLPEKDFKVLDIGPSIFSQALTKKFSEVDTLGLECDNDNEYGHHYQFDLNNCQNEEKWRKDIGKYDLIIMTEVIEHIYCAPNFVLRFIKSIMNENCVLVLQTPNAIALYNRLKMAFGFTPFELIARGELTECGHFREYTKKELEYFITKECLSIIEITMENYFDYKYAFHYDNKTAKKRNYLHIVNLLYEICPSSLKPGITLIAQNREHSFC